MNNKTFRDREILSHAQERGPFSTLGAYFRLSGPGWLQSAITLGGGSLGGALYLGVIGGSSMLWLQMLAIIIGVIMLSAISYVTLSTGKRPYGAINEYVNPVLGVAWITATILANMIFILPQFSLCFDVLDRNFPVMERLTNMLAAGNTGAEELKTAAYQAKVAVSAVIASLAFAIVCMSFTPGWAAKIFDLLLKAIVGAIVICFVVAVIFLTQQNQIDWQQALLGFIPDFSQWWNPAPKLSEMVNGLEGVSNSFWKEQLVERQQQIMLSTTATAVGINMTFLLPYSMLARGWDKTFRGLARWDLITGMAIPFIVVTSCIVLASANAFHAKIDDEFKSNDTALIQTSRIFNGTKGNVKKRMKASDPSAFAAIVAMPASTLEELTAQSAAENQLIAEFIATMGEEEKTIAAALVKPNTEQLAKTLEVVPILGEYADIVFGLGVLGMGFSSIIILMMINGYAFAEIINAYQSNAARVTGALAAALVGFAWFEIWTGESKTYLVIVASSFAVILLPIAYFTFMALMNNRELLGDEKPTGVRMSIWNLLMTIGVFSAVAMAYASISTKIGAATGPYVIGGVVTFLILAIVGFTARPRHNE